MGRAAVRGVSRDACFGAALQVALNLVPVLAGVRVEWSENLKPHDDARFALVYSCAIPVGALLVVVLGDPLQITTFSMALNALLAPVICVSAADPDERSALPSRISQRSSATCSFPPSS